MSPSPAQIRSLYRALLRELPRRPLVAPSHVQRRIRDTIAAQPTDDAQSQLDLGDQLLQYIKAQRKYTALLERYNPGLTAKQGNRTRATARRVGMILPKEFKMPAETSVPPLAQK